MDKINMTKIIRAYKKERELNERLEVCKTGQENKSPIYYINDKNLDIEKYWEEKVAEASVEHDDAEFELHKLTMRLREEIEIVEKRCSCRTITCDEIIEAILEIEEKLGISRKNLNGVEAWVDLRATQLPHSYKWKCQSTQFKLRHEKDSWYVVDICRMNTGTTFKRYNVTLTDEAHEALVDKYRRF